MASQRVSVRTRLITAAVVCFVLAFGALLVFLFLRQPTLAKVKDLVGFCSLAVALVGVGLTVRAQRLPPADPASAMPSAERDLADVVRAQWRAEASGRGLLTNALRVRWASTSRAIQADAETIAPADGTKVTKLRWTGEVTEAAARFRKLPARRLVVIGEPGAGKSSLAALLACGLLADRPPEEPVPVLLNLVGWDPHGEHLDDWLARRVEEEYPLLRDRRRFGGGMAARLISGGRVFPVLDGLDEMPDEVRATALDGIAAAVEVDRPFVLTCRTQEFTELIERTDTPLARAAVVELEPVTVGAVADYLPGGQIGGGKRWEAVVEEVKAHPDDALAVVLSTPLMITLARKVYESPQTDPRELLRMASVAELEAHLLDAYLPAVYRRGGPARPGAARRRDYEIGDIQRWLRFMATELTGRHEIDIAWWRTPRWLPASVERLLVSAAVLAFLGLAIATLAFRGNFWGFSMVVFPLMVLIGLERSGRPHSFDFSVLRALAGGSASGVMMGVVLLVGWGWVDESGKSALLFVIAMAGLGFGIGRKSRDVELASPGAALRGDRRNLLTILAGTAVLFFTSIVVAVEGSAAMHIWVRSIGYTLAIAASVLTLILCVGWSGAAWFRFCVARAWLGARRKMPLRQMTFLEDAHRRGVLRQVGAVYQFRHLRLQEHLAASDPTRHPQAPEVVVGAA